VCGRFTVALTKEDVEGFLKRDFAIDVTIDYPFPRFNIAPKQDILGLISIEKQMKATIFTWGFVPNFTKKDGQKLSLINSRVESLEDKWFLKEAYKDRRCLILADGFYEWETTDLGKLPYRIRKEDKELFYFAGIYSKSYGPRGGHLTCSILTKQALGKIRKIHDRMPLMMKAKQAEVYLREGVLDEGNLLEDKELYMYPVSKLVNKVSVDQKECLEEDQPIRLDL
jgi:putative SOS response-associated peptidase YedK